MAKHEDHGGINSETEAFFCPACHEMHPTPHWHDRYEAYLDREQWIENYINSVGRFKTDLSASRLLKAYDDYLLAMDLVYCETQGACVACEKCTHFRHAATGHYLCSDECRYSEWRAYGYTLARMADPAVFAMACRRLEQEGALPVGEVVEDVDGSLHRHYSVHGHKVLVASDAEIDAVFVDSPIDLSGVLQEMVLRAYRHSDRLWSLIEKDQ